MVLEWQWLSAMFLYFAIDEMVTSSVISEQDRQAHLVVVVVVVMTALTTQMRTSFQLMNRMISDKFRLNHIQDRHMTVHNSGLLILLSVHSVAVDLCEVFVSPLSSVGSTDRVFSKC